eukprot:6699644-Alexandrium_andersonii.AAC.1
MLVAAQHQQACFLKDADARMQADLILSTQQLDRPAMRPPVLWLARPITAPPVEVLGERPPIGTKPAASLTLLHRAALRGRGGQA